MKETRRPTKGRDEKIFAVALARELGWGGRLRRPPGRRDGPRRLPEGPA
jgi:hypothetical protein